jgi:rSAM/selenodomain-associated transferase 1
MTVRVVVIAKEPVAGRVKTRLCPPCTPAQAAALAEASLRDTLAAVAKTGARGMVALEGEPGDWLPPGFAVFPQRGDGLGERLAGAVAEAGGPLLLIGGDTPQVTPELLTGALSSLTTADAALGPAVDGGYWAIGLSRADPRVFDGVSMSTSHTGAEQLSRLNALGLRTRLLPPLRDVDYFADAVAVAQAVPTTRFACALAALRLAALESRSALLGER